jgi:hypothetical protein
VRTRAVDDGDPVLLFCELGNAERDRGIYEVRDHVDLVDIKPFARQCRRRIGLVLVIWTSASIGLPNTLPPKSSTAIRTAVTAPSPDSQENWPDMSVSTPILTASSEIAGVCADAQPIPRSGDNGEDPFALKSNPHR